MRHLSAQTDFLWYQSFCHLKQLLACDSKSEPADSIASCGGLVSSSACCWAWLLPETSVPRVSWGRGEPARPWGRASSVLEQLRPSDVRQSMLAIPPASFLLATAAHMHSPTWATWGSTRWKRTECRIRRGWGWGWWQSWSKRWQTLTSENQFRHLLHWPHGLTWGSPWCSDEVHNITEILWS